MTFCLAIVTGIAVVYERTLVGRHEGPASKMFSLRETEPCEPYVELVDPLDNWTARALQNLTKTVWVDEQYWNQCQVTNSGATVFKYGQKFYTAAMWAHRPVGIRVDPLRETGSGISISLCKATYSPNITCYELTDPLDPWTEAALQDLINTVDVDNVYRDQCALLKPRLTDREQHPIFKYNNEYYTMDPYLGFGFYDSFKPTVPIMDLIIVAWIVLGLLWVGSSTYLAKKAGMNVTA